MQLFADGSLGASTAALRLPYRCGMHGHGILNHKQETFNTLVQRSHQAGFQLEVTMAAVGLLGSCQLTSFYV